MPSLPEPPSPVINRTREGSGVVLSCECKWLRWFATSTDADAGQHEHSKRCKGAPVKSEKPVKRARSIGWNDREGATWIDSL